MPDLLKTEKDTVTSVNHSIYTFMQRNIEQAATISPYYEQLWSDIYRLIQSGGKRLRPKMVVMAYESFGGVDNDKIIPIAAAQELLHLSLLVHDDIIDRDYIRYGVDNITGRYDNSYYQSVENDEDRLHYSQSAALLAGDLLLSGSYQLMLESTIEPALLQSIYKIHGNSIYEVAGGELIDTESAFRFHGVIDAKTVALYKTASYTFVGPLLIGAMLAGIVDDKIRYLKEFAINLGIAYQLRDDVIGIFGDEEKIGKTTIGDIREGKYTYMVEQFYEHATEKEKLLFGQYFGDKDVQKNEAETVRSVLVSSGALEKTEKAIEQYSRSAERALAKLELSNQNQLQNLITTVTERDV